MKDNKPVHRILVVDDNPSIHEDFRKILCSARNHSGATFRNLDAEFFGAGAPETVPAEFEMDSAFQGQEALTKVEAAEQEGRPYSLAFMDVRMPPGWDGIETISRIWQEHPAIQVVICTAYSDYSWENILGKLGESDNLLILKKPFENVEVLQLAHALTKKWTITRQVASHMADLDKRVQDRTRELVDANQKLEGEIQQRAAMEAALRDSEERFHKAFETASIALTILRADSRRIIDANGSFARLLGQPQADLLGKTAMEMGLFGTSEKWDEFIRRLASGERLSNLELTVQHSDGQSRQTLVSLEPLALDNEPHILAALLDVTDQRHLESQLRQSQKMEAVGQLAAGVAHDFNNLLTVIHGHVSIQLAKANLERGIAKSLEQVKLASERAAALTRQLLAFSRKQIVQCKPLDLGAAVSHLLEMLQRMVGETIKLEWHAAPDCAVVYADQMNLEQVIMNLVLNARDAMPNGGTIRLTVETTELAAATRRDPDAREGRHVVLTVTDTGCGMDPQTLNRLFEPFFTTKPTGKGTGLGLATVYGIVKQHRGWLEVESAPGKGSTFRVFLPAAEAPAESPKPATPGTTDQPSKINGETILVVEDEPAVREYVRSVLTDNGYTVMEAGSSTDAMLVWQTAGKKINLLLTDMVMPNGVSGSVLAGRLLQRDRDLKVVYSSGYSSEVVAQDLHLQDGVNFLPKPFTPEQLLGVVCRALTRAPQGAELAAPVPAAA